MLLFAYICNCFGCCVMFFAIYILCFDFMKNCCCICVHACWIHCLLLSTCNCCPLLCANEMQLSSVSDQFTDSSTARSFQWHSSFVTSFWQQSRCRSLWRGNVVDAVWLSWAWLFHQSRWTSWHETGWRSVDFVYPLLPYMCILLRQSKIFHVLSDTFLPCFIVYVRCIRVKVSI